MLDSSTGVISGIPTASGDHAFGLQVLGAGVCSVEVEVDASIRVRHAVALVAAAGHGEPNPNRVIVHSQGGVVLADILAYAADHWGANVAATDRDYDNYRKFYRTTQVK